MNSGNHETLLAGFLAQTHTSVDALVAEGRTTNAIIFVPFLCCACVRHLTSRCLQ